MKFKRLFVAVPLVPSIFGAGASHAGQTLNEGGTIVCAMDKWDEKEPEKGHKLVDSTFRCLLIHDNPAGSKTTENCKGKYEYMPGGSWKGAGTCTDTYYGGDKIFVSWEEGSNLKPYVYTKTGGTGRYQGVSGAGTYVYDNLTDNFTAGLADISARTRNVRFTPQSGYSRGRIDG
jgi:hypothetical protein